MSASIGMLGEPEHNTTCGNHLFSSKYIRCIFLRFLSPLAGEKFDEKGNLTDEKTKEFVKAQLEALIVWTRKINQFRKINVQTINAVLFNHVCRCQTILPLSWA